MCRIEKIIAKYGMDVSKLMGERYMNFLPATWSYLRYVIVGDYITKLC